MILQRKLSNNKILFTLVYPYNKILFTLVYPNNKILFTLTIRFCLP